MSDHYALEKIAHYQIAEFLKSQEQARLAAQFERALRQRDHTSARLPLRGLLRTLTLALPFVKLNAITR